MGFYAPAQLVQDVRRHGVEVRPVDVRTSFWDCILEPHPRESDCESRGQPALRLGLRMVKGLTRAAAMRIVAERAVLVFSGVDDLSRRCGLGRRDLHALAAADALAGMAGDRHQARWAVAGVGGAIPVLEGAAFREDPAPLPIPTEGEQIMADYRSIGLTLHRHPLALLRHRLASLGLFTAARVYQTDHGRPARTAGLVITRQRPSSASGVTFVTLEDETGTVNVIVWTKLAERQRRVLLGAQLMAVVGEVQREGEVLHLIARRLEDHTSLLGGLVTRSRDFH